MYLLLESKLIWHQNSVSDRFNLWSAGWVIHHGHGLGKVRNAVQLHASISLSDLHDCEVNIKQS
jgi:hypothetical protein